MKGKSKGATKKSKPMKLPAKTQDGVIGPKNPQTYGKKKSRS